MRTRYDRILLRLLKNSLIRELSFRGHFIVNVVSELLWVGMLLVFIKVIFRATPEVRGWSEHQYLFLMGTHMLVTSLFQAFFFQNCWRVTHLVRTGDLDFVLLRPANTQFLLSFDRINYSALASVPVGIALCTHAVLAEGRVVSPGQVGLFMLLILAGIVTLYSLLFMFSITSIWLIRQTGVDHLWFYAVNLARYPAEIYKQFAGGALWFALVFIAPLLMVANLPANVVVRVAQPFMIVYFVVASVVLLGISSVVFRLALRSYRSASS
ncbi:MAG: ABC-2 family transporter protein [Planctomycetes bacterium]|nr:ABC-2 family transporter protein [Planctomycetota bacterium]